MPLTLDRESVLYKSGAGKEKVLQLKLPLPDLGTDLFKLEAYVAAEDDDTVGLETAYYRNQIASNSGIFTRKQHGLGGFSKPSVKSILWRSLKSSQVVELIPIDVESSSAGAGDGLHRSIGLKTIRIVTPLPVYDRCVVCSEQDDHLIVDILVKPGLLYTLQLGYDQFEDVDDGILVLSDSNAHKWRSVKNPYGFDIHQPYLLHSISSKVLICSTVDGNLVRFFRNTPLGDINWYQFQDSSKGLSSLTSFLPWNHSNIVPGKPDLSPRTIISVDSVGSVSDASLLITVSINRQLKLWSLESMSVVTENLLEYRLESSSASKQPASSFYLDSSATPRHVSFASHYQDKSHGLHHNIFITYIPFNEGLFKIWQLNEASDTPGIVDLGENYQIVPLPPNDKNSIWFIADFKLVSYIDRLVLVVSWKSDTGTVIKSYVMPKDSKSSPAYWTNAQFESFDKEDLSILDLSSSSAEPNSESFIHHIFGPNGYSAETIKTALNVYASHYGETVDETPSSSLKSLVCRVVGKTISVSNIESLSNFKTYKKDLHLQWKKFNRLCSELEKQGNEFLGLSYDDHINRFYIIKSSSVYLLRPLTHLELIYFNRSPSPDKSEVDVISSILGTIDCPLVEKILRTLDLLANFRRLLARDVKSDLLIALKEQFNNREMYLTADRISYMYETIFDEKITESSLAIVINSLYEISDLDNVIQAIIRVCESNGEEKGIRPFTYLGVQSFNSMLYNFSSTGRIISIDILILLLLSSSSESTTLVGEEITDYAKFFKIFKSFTGVMELQLNGPFSNDFHDLETDDSVESAVQRLSFNDKTDTSRNLSFLESFLVNNKVVVQSIESIWGLVDLRDEVKLGELVVDMFLQVKNQLNDGNKSFLVEYINTYLPFDTFSTFIKGNILLCIGESAKASYLIRSSSIDLSSKGSKLSSAKLNILKKLSEIYWLPGGLNNGIAYYNNSVSQVAYSIGDSTMALEFAQYAMDHLQDEDDELAIQIYTTTLLTSIDLRQYDEAYNALIELDLYSCEEKKLRKLIEKFITSMANNGEGLKLCQLPFIGMTNVLSNILEERLESEDDSIIANYKLLYSWKVERGDYQGGE